MARNYSMDVNITKDPAIFLFGESVTGNMVVNVGSAMKVRGICIRILGQINTCIKIRKYGENNVSITDEITPTGYYEVHRETESYIDQQVTAWGNEISAGIRAEPPLLNAGRYQFDFAFELPAQNRMPSSFMFGDKCSASYKIIGKMVIPDKDAHIVEKKFIFLESIDVTEPFLALPTTQEINETSICCCCCESGPIQLKAWLDHSGYRSGDTMILNAECRNSSKWWLQCIHAKLIRQVNWSAKGRFRKKSVICFEIESPTGIASGRTFEWKDRQIKLKPMPPSITSYNLLSVSYELHVFMEVPLYNGEFKVVIPVIIGTTPLPTDQPVINYDHLTSPTASLAVIQTQPRPIGAPSTGRSSSILPPSYDEVIEDKNSNITRTPTIEGVANVSNVAVQVTDF